MGIPMELFAEPSTVAESLMQVRQLATAIKQPARGEALVARIEAALDAARPPAGIPPITALMYQRNGFSSGRDTVMDEMMTRVGFTNLAATYGLADWGNVPLETVIQSPPQVLLAGATVPGMPTWADRVVRHPALRRLAMKITPFPEQLIYCGGPVLIQAAAALAAARDLAVNNRP
jgi:iron complex transport system substrate-binding protein